MGFGDVVPTTDGGKVFTMFYCLGTSLIVVRYSHSIYLFDIIT